MRGAVPEAEFMQLAEATGFIVALGEWALKNACARRRQLAGPARRRHTGVHTPAAAIPTA